jgi:hypothetical protein
MSTRSSSWWCLAQRTNTNNQQVIRRSLCFCGDSSRGYRESLRVSRSVTIDSVSSCPSISINLRLARVSIYRGGRNGRSENLTPFLGGVRSSAAQSLAITHDRDCLAPVKITLTCYGAVVPIMVASLRLLAVSRSCTHRLDCVLIYAQQHVRSRPH